MKLKKDMFDNNRKILVKMLHKKEKFNKDNMLKNGMDEDFINEMFYNKIFYYIKRYDDLESNIWINWRTNRRYNGATLNNYAKKYFPSKKQKYKLLTMHNDLDLFKINQTYMNKPNETFRQEYADYVIYHKETSDCSKGVTLISFFQTSNCLSIDWQISGMFVDCSDYNMLYTFIESIYSASTKLLGVCTPYDFVDCVDIMVDDCMVDDEIILDMLENV